MTPVSSTEARHLSDASLVRQAQRGNLDAFSALVRRYQRAAYLLALGVTRHPENAEDVAQESFLVALDRLDECRDPARFAGWFTTIVKNRARNMVRRESLRETESIDALPMSGGDDPYRSTVRAELRDQLADALGELSPLQRQVVLLHDLEGWKHREIGERLGMPAGTVRSHLHFARRRLRILLQADRTGSSGREEAV
jgi:RNA polymerase sigma-70 factor, ECF subfamily